MVRVPTNNSGLALAYLDYQGRVWYPVELSGDWHVHCIVVHTGRRGSFYDYDRVHHMTLRHKTSLDRTGADDQVEYARELWELCGAYLRTEDGYMDYLDTSRDVREFCRERM